MFEVALIFLAGKGIFELYKYIKRSHEDDISKLLHSSKDNLTYIDSRGRMRLKSNNHIVVYTIEHNHHVLKDLKTFEILKDYTYEKQQKEYEKSKAKAIAEGKRIFCIDFDTHTHDKINGMRYKNMDTGEIYVIRQIGGWRIPWYMNLKGKFIAPVDSNWKPPKIFGQDPGVKVNIWKEFEKYQNNEILTGPLWKAKNYLWSKWLDLEYCGKDWSEQDD